MVFFQQDQDWGDGGLQSVLQREYDLNRREDVLKAFLKAALNRVVEPLQRRQVRLPPRPSAGSQGPQAEGGARGRDYREP
jgi:hypothetical protein